MILNKTLNVLLADDDPKDHQKFHTALSSSGHSLKIDSVYNGIKLIDHLLAIEARKDPKTRILPDLVITDLYMPFAGGLQVLKQIKLHPNLRHIPIYVFSGMNDKVIQTKVLENGAAEFHHKTVSLEDLRVVINGILGRMSGIAPGAMDTNQVLQAKNG